VDRRTQQLFLALIAVQAAHSLEEYFFALYDVFAPARFASGLVSSNLPMGFAILNAAFVVFGLWCYFARVRPGRSSARAWVWPWILIEAETASVTRPSPSCEKPTSRVLSRRRFCSFSRSRSAFGCFTGKTSVGRQPSSMRFQVTPDS
jgi:hypothetical protein